MHEEVVQLSRQEQRQEQRDLKRQQKRPQESQNQQQQNDAVHGNDASAPLPRRDRHNQQRPNRPNRHRDQSVLNETPVAVEAASNPQQLKVDVIDTPRTEPMNTALIVNIDQGQSEIVALNPQQTTAPAPQAEPVAAVVETIETATPAQAEQVAAETTPVEEATQAPAKRASNDPRSRRRHQRGAQSSQKAAAKIAPSQIPALGQYTMGGLIRHVYGEDCTILIEQFGLVTTFNRALQKFAEQYASTLVVETAAEEKRPVTRDAELPSQKPTEEAEPAPVLPLTPPEASASRVANDPRERRRLAKLAAEQAKEEHLASNTAPAAPVESTETTEEVQATAIEAVVAENTVADAAPEQQALALANEETPVVAEETAPAEVVEPQQPAVETEAAVVTETTEAVQAVENTETDAEDEAAKAEKEKSSRPRRPRGRPPKKSTVGNE